MRFLIKYYWLYSKSLAIINKKKYKEKQLIIKLRLFDKEPSINYATHLGDK